MDNLAKDAFMARQNGMTYGKYMANKKPSEKLAPQPRKGAYTRTCPVCGNSFVRYDRVFQKYCTERCKYNADKARLKAKDGKA